MFFPFYWITWCPKFSRALLLTENRGRAFWFMQLYPSVSHVGRTHRHVFFLLKRNTSLNPKKWPCFAVLCCTSCFSICDFSKHRSWNKTLVLAVGKRGFLVCCFLRGKEGEVPSDFAPPLVAFFNNFLLCARTSCVVPVFWFEFLLHEFYNSHERDSLVMKSRFEFGPTQFSKS